MKTKHHSILSAPVTQRGDQRLNNTIHRKWSALALGGFLFTFIFALSAPSVEAECQQWDVGHRWRFKQGPTPVDLDLQQNGTVVTGTATHDLKVDSSGHFKSSYLPVPVGGKVDGTVKGDRFAVHIYWDNNTVGVYNGTIRPSGRIEGTGYEQRSPSTKVNWYSVSTMKCADAANQPKTTTQSEKLRDQINKASAQPATTPSQLPVYPGSGSSGSGTKGGFIQMFPTTPTPAANPEAAESSSSDTEDQPGKHKKKNKKKNKKKHHHHDDDNQDQGND